MDLGRVSFMSGNLNLAFDVFRSLAASQTKPPSFPIDELQTYIRADKSHTAKENVSSKTSSRPPVKSPSDLTELLVHYTLSPHVKPEEVEEVMTSITPLCPPDERTLTPLCGCCSLPSFVVIHPLLWTLDFETTCRHVSSAKSALPDLVRTMEFMLGETPHSESPEVSVFLLKSKMSANIARDYKQACLFVDEAIRRSSLQLQWHRAELDCRFSSCSSLMSVLSGSTSAQLTLKLPVLAAFMSDPDNLPMASSNRFLFSPDTSALSLLARVASDPSDLASIHSLVSQMTLIFILEQDSMCPQDLDRFTSLLTNYKLLTILGSLLLTLFLKNDPNASPKLKYPEMSLWSSVSPWRNDSIDISSLKCSINVFFSRMTSLGHISWLGVECDFFLHCDDPRQALKCLTLYLCVSSGMFHPDLLPPLLSHETLRKLIKCSKSLSLTGQMAVLAQYIPDYSTCFAGIGDVGLDSVDLLLDHFWDVTVLEHIHGVYVREGKAVMAELIVNLMGNRDLSPFNSEQLAKMQRALKMTRWMGYMFKQNWLC